MELASFGLSEARSQAMPSGATVPAVSMVMCFPALQAAASS